MTKRATEWYVWYIPAVPSATRNSSSLTARQDNDEGKLLLMAAWNEARVVVQDTGTFCWGKAGLNKLTATHTL